MNEAPVVGWHEPGFPAPTKRLQVDARTAPPCMAHVAGSGDDCPNRAEVRLKRDGYLGYLYLCATCARGWH